MSSLSYSNSPGYGQQLSDRSNYSQAVRIPSNATIVKISGQGGWASDNGYIPDPSSQQALDDQIEQAFRNVDIVLKTAGASGWEGVYLARIFYVGVDDAAIAKTVECIGRWCPNHRPALTAIGVEKLALKNMRVEVEVEAVADSNAA